MKRLSNTTGGIDFGSMTYDPAYGQVMTYGGFDVTHGNSVLTNPWSWNGSTWQQVTLSPRPPSRVLAASAYDAATDQLVLFGGVGSSTWLGDTWVLSPRRVVVGDAESFVRRGPAVDCCSGVGVSVSQRW